ncbi:hypothetical protein [Klebsiella aerogenes]|uniref:hypothetical protein n=1 Tax=Klebsiella aerogenes TaxID=548 RepID=UPI0034D37AA6
MLTIRLKQNGVLRAFQTNRVVKLLPAADEEYKSIMHLIDVPQPGDVMMVDGVPRVLTTRDPSLSYPSAAVYLSQRVDVLSSDSFGDARIICLYEGDSAHVIDSGVTLFEWPAKLK